MMQFTRPFKAVRNKHYHSVELSDVLEKVEDKPLTEKSITWFNERFCMELRTELQFVIGYPIVLLTILDAIYRNKVPWQKMDWRFRYRQAIQKNYECLYAVWHDVSMDKVRSFRLGDTHLRIEGMKSASVRVKLEFLELVRVWFDTRIHYSPPYDPVGRRRWIAEHCRKKGYNVDFPSWIPFDQDLLDDVFAKRSSFNRMPEYKRLTWFLGSTNILEM